MFSYTIVSSYTDSTPKRMGGAYYGVSYEEKILSDANPQKGTISDESPVGKALLNHIEGDVIIVSLPTGVNKKYRIIKIEDQILT